MRLCGCGCGESMEGRAVNARYASAACRARAWKAQTGYGPQKGREGRSNVSGSGVRLYVGDVDDAQRAAAMLPFLASTMTLTENERALRALAGALERSLARRHSGK
jgi:hypothetical protein